MLEKRQFVKIKKLVVTVGAITSFKAVKADTFEVTFDKAQPEAVTAEVRKDANTDVIALTSTWNTERTVLTLKSANKLATGEYTVTVKNGDASVTEKASVTEQKATDITFSSTTALTGKENTEAYMYYDVVDQYGDSMRTSSNISWTISSCKNVKVDKATGRITATKDSNNSSASANTFNFGDQIYVVGVDVKNNISKTATFTVGMAQAVDKVEMAGFVNKNDKTKLVDLPKNFAKDTYYLAYRTYDQNGDLIEAATYDNSVITFIADAPLIIDSSIKTAGQIFTIDGVDYASVAVNPGDYADRGGEVTFTAISNKTGNKQTKVFTVGKAARLKSLVINAPTGTVADGEQNVKLSYTATDMDNNAVTSYDTIVRSSNALTLNAGDNTELYIKEENDGTAGIYWSDNKDQVAALSDSSAYDGLDRSILLSTIVIGGETSNTMLSVADARRPSSIKSIKLNDDNNNALVAGNTADIDVYTDKVQYVDQYNNDLHINIARKFFEIAGSSNGFDRENYAIKVTTTSEDRKDFIAAEEAGLKGTSGVQYYKWGDGVINFSATESITARGNVTLKYSIVSKRTNETSDDQFSEINRAYNVNYTIVPKSEVIENLSINPRVNKYQVTTSMSGYANGSSMTNSAIIVDENGTLPVTKNDDTIFTVKGTTRDNLTLTLPSSAYLKADASQFNIDGTKLDSVSGSAVRWGELYDFNTTKNTRILATKRLVLDVYKGQKLGETELGTTVSKNIQISDEQSYPVDIKFWNTVDNVAIDSAVVNPTNAEIAMLPIKVFDQFGHELTDRQEIQSAKAYNVALDKENSDDTAYLTNSFAVTRNNSANPVIKGAEIKDTFKLTATLEGFNLSKTIPVTVGSDNKARHSSISDRDTDEKFRKEVLGMKR